MPSKRKIQKKRMKTVVEETTQPEAVEPSINNLPLSVASPIQNQSHVTVPVQPETTVTPTPVTELLPQEPTLIPQPESQSESESQDDTETSKSKKILKLAMITLLVIVLVGLISGGVYTYLKGIKKIENSRTEENTSTSEPTIEVNISPTVTPTPEIKLSSFKVSVLNGEGVPGVAGKVKTILEKAGFSVSNTGNAKDYNFTVTVIQTKKNVSQAVVDTLKKTLSDGYTIKVGDTLEEKEVFDIIVTVGLK